MRRIRGGIFLSLDGVMQAPGGPSEDPTGGFAHGGWAAGLFDDHVGEAVGRLFSTPYELLLGRRTFEIFAAHWPHATGEDASMGEAFTATNKWVLSRGGASLDWANSHRLAGIEAVAALKTSEGPDLLIQGSSTLYPALLDAGLLDEVTLLIFPVLLGAGKRPFGADTPARGLRLVDHSVSPDGVVIATYQPAGAPAVGDFAIAPASPEEQARQRRMAENRW